MILSVIEKLSSLDQTSTELFRDILVKYGPQLEDDNPGKMHIPYSRHFFFFKMWYLSFVGRGHSNSLLKVYNLSSQTMQTSTLKYMTTGMNFLAIH